MVTLFIPLVLILTSSFPNPATAQQQSFQCSTCRSLDKNGFATEQFQGRLGIDKSTPKDQVAALLCFGESQSAKKEIGRIDQQMLLNTFSAIEGVGLPLNQAFKTAECDLDRSKPLEFMMKFEGNRVPDYMVAALAEYARKMGKGDAWLADILFDKIYKKDLFNSSSKQSIYDEYQSTVIESSKKIPEEERKYRIGLEGFSALNLRLFGKNGLVIDSPYFASHFSIKSLDKFWYCNEFRDNRKRELWMQRARLAAKGEWAPRGMMIEALTLDAIQKCMQEPEMESKLATTQSALSAHWKLSGHKEVIKTNIDLIVEMQNSQKQLCPPGVSVVSSQPYCARDFKPLVEKLKHLTNNDLSGLTVADFEKNR